MNAHRLVLVGGLIVVIGLAIGAYILGQRASGASTPTGEDVAAPPRMIIVPVALDKPREIAPTPSAPSEVPSPPAAPPPADPWPNLPSDAELRKTAAQKAEELLEARAPYITVTRFREERVIKRGIYTSRYRDIEYETRKVPYPVTRRAAAICHESGVALRRTPEEIVARVRGEYETSRAPGTRVPSASATVYLRLVRFAGDLGRDQYDWELRQGEPTETTEPSKTTGG
ncbi:MAG: hypothetical protein SFX74_06265 [Fimbriimonadaceae bacterium]|nr:hypothetical protein [Fimbriimonadaceae bacterium]